MLPIKTKTKLVLLKTQYINNYFYQFICLNKPIVKFELIYLYKMGSNYTPGFHNMYEWSPSSSTTQHDISQVVQK